MHMMDDLNKITCPSYFNDVWKTRMLPYEKMVSVSDRLIASIVSWYVNQYFHDREYLDVTKGVPPKHIFVSQMPN